MNIDFIFQFFPITFLKRLSKHPMISLSFVIILGSLVSSFLSFLFNLFMSRNLTVSDYGTLTSLVSLITLAIMPAGALVPTIVHFSAKYFAHNQEDLAYGLFMKVGKMALFIGLVLLLFFLLLSPQLATFFHITDPKLLIVPGIIVFISYLNIMNTGLLQAKLAFGFITFSQFMGALSKLLIGVLFVFLGYSVMGGMWAFFLAYIIPYLLSFIPLKFLFKKHVTKNALSLKELLAYGAPSTLTLFSLTSFITIDTLLVKHFFDPGSAGIYAGISLLGRIIFFATSPIGTVMFPLVVRKVAKHESIRSTLILAFLMVMVPSLILTGVFYLIPDVVISLSLKNTQYLQGASLLGLMGLYMTLYSLLYIITNFCLSIGKTKIVFPIVLGGVLQIGLLWLFHETYFQIVGISIGIVSLLLVILIGYIIRYGIKRN